MSYNKVRPQSRAEARIWNTYNNWDWHPIRVWPKFIAEGVIRQNLTNSSRFALLLYLIGNGMGPEKAEGVIYDIGGKNFDYEAKNQIAWLVKNLDQLERYKYYDEHLRAWTPFTYFGDKVQAKKGIGMRKVSKHVVDDAVIVPQYKESWAMINKNRKREEEEEWRPKGPKRIKSYEEIQKEFFNKY